MSKRIGCRELVNVDREFPNSQEERGEFGNSRSCLCSLGGGEPFLEDGNVSLGPDQRRKLGGGAPADLAMFGGMGSAVEQFAAEREEEDPDVVVSPVDRRKRVDHADADVELFGQLANEGGFHALACFNLAAGKFPESPQMFFRRAEAGEYPAIVFDDSADDVNGGLGHGGRMEGKDGLEVNPAEKRNGPPEEPVVR